MAKDINKSLAVKHMEELYSQGIGYHDIGKEISRKFGLTFSDDTIRYYVNRRYQMQDTKTEAQRLAEKGICKKLILSDIHIPFDGAPILDIVNKHKNEIDEIIFNGDTVDCFEISV